MIYFTCMGKSKETFKLSGIHFPLRADLRSCQWKVLPEAPRRTSNLSLGQQMKPIVIAYCCVDNGEKRKLVYHWRQKGLRNKCNKLSNLVLLGPLLVEHLPLAIFVLPKLSPTTYCR